VNAPAAVFSAYRNAPSSQRCDRGHQGSVIIYWSPRYHCEQAKCRECEREDVRAWMVKKYGAASVEAHRPYWA